MGAWVGASLRCDSEDRGSAAAGLWSRAAAGSAAVEIDRARGEPDNGKAAGAAARWGSNPDATTSRPC
jgi:hypothetical protein|eukprot:COSAG02_NODE_131_length_34710_cov_17.171159_43_plen_68_part_00